MTSLNVRNVHFGLMRSYLGPTRHESDPFRHVVDLSKKGFTVNEYKLSGYNLNFVPTMVQINELLHDIKKINRRFKLRAHFGNALPKGDLYFKSESNWEPSNTHHTVKTSADDLKNKITNSLETVN